jgi:cytochrome b
MVDKALEAHEARRLIEDSIRVWDAFLRLFHWGLVLAFALAYMSAEEHYGLHVWSGYAVLALIALRLLWGFVGTRHARFADFVAGPRRVSGYARAMLRGTPPRSTGHNPLGGWMVLALLADLSIIALSGVALDAAENRAGPLGGTRLFLYGDLIKHTHEITTDLGLGLIALHMLGVAGSSWLHRENLVGAMITGRKRKPD